MCRSSLQACHRYLPDPLTGSADLVLLFTFLQDLLCKLFRSTQKPFCTMWVKKYLGGYFWNITPQKESSQESAWHTLLNVSYSPRSMCTNSQLTVWVGQPGSEGAGFGLLQFSKPLPFPSEFCNPIKYFLCQALKKQKDSSLFTCHRQRGQNKQKQIIEQTKKIDFCPLSLYLWSDLRRCLIVTLKTFLSTDFSQ